MRPRRLLVPVLIALGVVSTAVGSLGAPLLPTIVTVDHVSLAGSQWALTISLLVGAVASPVLGRLGDGPHRRRVILATTAAVAAGCMLAALPWGYAGLLAGRALQGLGLALVPLAIAVARDALDAARARPAIVALSVTTAVGIGAGYPIAGVVTEYAGLAAAFWLGAAISAVALVLAAMVLPPSPVRPARRLDAAGALLLGVGVAAALLVLGQGHDWGWTSARLLAVGGLGAGCLVAWVFWELRLLYPLVDVRLLRHRGVLAANTTVLLVGTGVYPLLSLVVRLVQTPTSSGYGFGASPVVAGLMLVPFSLASFAATRVIAASARRVTPDLLVALSCVLLGATMTLFLVACTTIWGLVVVMALAGLGLGCVFAANPVQIVRDTPATETASAAGFYQVVRMVGFATGSALSATALVNSIPAGQVLPTSAGYRTAALVSIAVLVVATAAAAILARTPSALVRPATVPER